MTAGLEIEDEELVDVVEEEQDDEQLMVITSGSRWKNQMNKRPRGPTHNVSKLLKTIVLSSTGAYVSYLLPSSVLGVGCYTAFKPPPRREPEVSMSVGG